jgi:hypothetical protein
MSSPIIRRQRNDLYRLWWPLVEPAAPSRLLFYPTKASKTFDVAATPFKNLTSISICREPYPNNWAIIRCVLLRREGCFNVLARTKRVREVPKAVRYRSPGSNHAPTRKRTDHNAQHRAEDKWR